MDSSRGSTKLYGSCFYSDNFLLWKGMTESREYDSEKDLQAWNIWVEKSRGKIDSLVQALQSEPVEDVIEAYRYSRQIGNVEDPFLKQQSVLLGLALSDLPKTDVERAREIFTAQAESPVSFDRQHAAIFLFQLAESGDRGHIKPYLERLLRDSDMTVRQRAHEYLEDNYLYLLNESSQRPEDLGADAVFTPDEVAWLHHVFLQAEAGHGLYDPQQEAFVRIMGHVKDPEGGQQAS
ncbi:hypothetical protein ETD83_29535 [Actinomadura soli]|uniref:HEAT repeat domain-containing protein n=1 Tax=Actinomadura soli TaxID=2508997 RepID=A0A5C4J777_9ACTN|nr:hypothetical protein [Actinomadura soli]TMQ91746.1 hypothetical protein ETD83_29535 [Actinomadura soli]